LDFRIIVTEIVEDSKQLRSVRRDPHAIELAFFLLLDNDEAGHALPSSESDDGIFRALLQHWAIARIDTPLDVIARFDEAAKQLIAVGGIIQAAYVAGFAFGGLKGALPTWGIVLLFAPLILMIFCAAKVICLVPKELQAFSTYELFKQMRSGIEEAKIDSAMNEWCKGIDSLAKKKRLWLHAANLSFVFAFAITLGIVGWFAMR
jgi:hypothetical protein